MSSISDVFEYVKTSLIIGTDNDDKDVETFLISLEKSAFLNCQKLLVCIGIDLKAYFNFFGIGSIACKCYVEKLRKIMIDTIRYPIDLKSSSRPAAPSICFSIYLKKHLKTCLPNIKAPNIPEYIKISSFRNFLQFIVLYNKEFNPHIDSSFNIDDQDKFLLEYFANDVLDELFINRLSGKNEWVFITDKDDLSVNLNNKNTSILLDSIGFYTGNINKAYKYVSISYPKNFNENCYQPSSLFGDWGDTSDPGNEFFMTYKNDNLCWGRTFSVSGTLASEKERIHKKFVLSDDETYKFSVNNLGELNDPITRTEDDNILNEALKRFDDA